MEKPSYHLDLDKKPKEYLSGRGYQKNLLEDMTTIQLKEICIREKIIKGIVNPLDRRELIETILRYRGAQDANFIKRPYAGGMERIQAILKKKLREEPDESTELHNPAKITLYDNLDMTIFDHFEVADMRTKKRLSEGNAILTAEDMTICALLNVHHSDKEGVYYLTRSAELPLQNFPQKSYYMLYFNKRESDYLYQTFYDIPKTPYAILPYYRIPLAEAELRTAEITHTVLAIDFGTSSTTAGAYLDHHYIEQLNQNDIKNGEIQVEEVNLVKFIDSTSEENKWSLLLPAIAAVADCSQTDAVCFHFGYDAKNDVRTKYQDEAFSVFYEMKRWAEDFEQEQEVIDRSGNTAKVKRGEILRQYLLYVITCAQQQFKCQFQKLLLTCPVKLKQQFKRMFASALPEYELMENCELDEGTAVLFNTIQTMMEMKSYPQGEEVLAMIMDCGGGTSDLSSCSFRIQQDTVSYHIAIETVYENGDTNFGGNNLTYRILQYIKIVFAAFYTNQTIPSVQQLLMVSMREIYRFVDKNGKCMLYSGLERAYNEAEQVIPTRFRDYENRTRKNYYMVKNNFYFLYEIAEKLKQAFFQENDVLRCCFKKAGMGSQDLEIIEVPNWNLVIRTKEELKYLHEYPDYIFNILEINHLLQGDIYDLLNRFLYLFYKDDILADYSLFRLTGQSCRIPLFQEALKEFLPGKEITIRSNADLKLSCVKGALRYHQAIHTGVAEVELTSRLPKIPYLISGFTHTGEEKVLISSLGERKRYGFLSRNKGMARLELLLKNEKKETQFYYYYNYDQKKAKPVTYEQLLEQYVDYSECILQDDTDTITDHEVKFFVFAAHDRWGFFVVPVMREKTQLYLGEDAYYAFENNLWEVDFFDGQK